MLKRNVFKEKPGLIHKQNKFIASLLLCSLLASGTLLSGTQTALADEDNFFSRMLSTENLSTGAGAILGGVLGSQVGDGNGQLVMTALGVAVGGYIGSEIGITLTEDDQRDLGQKSTYTASKAKDNETITWNNPDTGARARITPRNTHQELRQVAIVRDKRVSPPPPLEIIGETYAAFESSNVRSNPQISAPIVASLYAGERVNAVGKVKGTEWIMVSRNGKTIGYVYAPLLNPAPDYKERELSKAIDFDALEDQFDGDNSVVVEQVSAAVECRDLEYNVTTKEDHTNKTVNVCKSANGAWEMI